MAKQYKLTFIFLSVAAFYAWLIFAAATPTLPSSENPVVLYSNQCRHDLKLTLSKALKESKESLYLEMYAITDPQILSLLESKQKEGMAATILYDRSASPPLEKRLAACPYLDKGLMHRKILVVDHTRTFLGSANLTPTSLIHHDNLLLGLHHPALAAHLESERPSSPFSFSLPGQTGELWLLPDRKGLDRLIEEIERAKKRIKIALFTFTHPRIADALIAAHARGVKVKVAIDCYTARGASSRVVEKLIDAGVPLFCSQGPQLLHHKWAWIDRKTLLLGSANWTKAAFEVNRDYFLILTPLLKKQKRFMRSLWKTIELESISQNE